MERAKSFVNVHKTSFQSDRVLPNDDLVLNQARRQKSFVGPSAKRIAQMQQKNPGENNVKVNSIQRASSMGNLDKKEEIVRVRSLVEVDDYDEAASPQLERKSSTTIQETLKVRQCLDYP